MIEITPAAQQYLNKIVSKPDNKDKALRLRALDPNTPYAEAGLEFITVGPEQTDDLLINYDQLSIYVDNKSQQYLKDAKIDLRQSDVAEELVIETPNLQPVSMLDESAPLFDQINYLLEMEINPSLAMHGGRAELVEVTRDNTVVLRFGGGCQGCGMIDVTLKQGIEQTLKERIPTIKAVQDVTDHEAGTNPYYG